MRNRLLILLSLLLPLAAAAVPVRRDRLTVTGADGLPHVILCRGDAFYHLMTTEDGCAVVRGDDGIFRYAAFDAQGFRHATAYPVGASDVPDAVLTASRLIPYELLRRNAGLRREKALRDPRPNLERRVRARHPATKDVTAPRHGLVILAQFPDEPFRFKREDFVQLLTGGSGSAVDYFNAQFGGAYDFEFTVTDIVSLSKKQSYYGKNDSEGNDLHATELIQEACLLADAEVDFSRFDDDGDGEVDNVFVIFSGKDEADDPDLNADCIWSHAYYLSAARMDVKLDGTTVDRYACTSELMILLDSGKYTLTGIGTFCHEYSHTFGLPDLYDTDYEGSGGRSSGLWHSTALMDAGNQNNNGRTPPGFNAVERHELGIGEAIPLTAGTYTLEPIQDSGTYYILQTDTEGEYYLFECRAAMGWDAYIGGSGLLIYHIDQSARAAGYSDTYGVRLTAEQRWWVYNEVNARPDHPCADLVEADPTAVFDAAGSQVKRVFWPQDGHTEFSVSSNPAFTFWSGQESFLALTDIRSLGRSVRFTVVGVLEPAPDVILKRSDVYQDAAIIQWSASDESYTGEGFLSVDLGGPEPEEFTVAPYAPGRYAYVLEGLSPRTPYKVRLYFKSGGVSGKINEECRFTTKSEYAGTYPYICLNDAERTDGGAFVAGTRIPLRVCNASKATGVSWTFDGSPIAPEGNGYYPLTRSGILRADVSYEDGSHDLILKKITVR